MIRVSRQNTIDSLTGGSLDREDKASLYCYALGGEILAFDAPVVALSAFRLDEGESSSELGASGRANSKVLEQTNLEFEQAKAVLRYEGCAPFAEINRAVRCWESGSLLQIDIDGEPMCWVDLDKAEVHLLNDLSFDEQLNLEVITGPALIALMAQNGVFCLHAGAVRTLAGNILFIAESGVGKSTLSADAGESWVQIADDISPLSMDEDGFYILPFPQLKLAQNKPANGIPQSDCSVDMIIRLSRQESSDIVITQLKPMDSFLQLIKHTVAAKLFNGHLLEEQAVFAQQLSSSVPMVEVAYPRDLTKLEDLRGEIARYLSERSTLS